MSIYYPAPCSEAEIIYDCDPCNPDEEGRIRHVAFIKKGFAFVDESDRQEWIDGIDAGDIQMIPNIRGEYDGGEDITAPGYGDVEERITGRKHTVKLFDNKVVQNCAFWNKMRTSKNWRLAFFTDTNVRITDKIVSVKPKTQIKAETTSVVENEITITFSQLNDPCPKARPDDIYDCFFTA